MNKQEIEKAIEQFKVDISYHESIIARNTEYPEYCKKERLYIDTLNLMISALTQQLNNGWIPVSQAPESIKHEHGEPIEFNVMLRGGRVATTGCVNNDGVWGWMDWCDLKFKPFGVDVLYWQPLPLPPEEV